MLGLYIYSQLDNKTNAKLSTRLGVDVKQAIDDNTPAVTVLVRRNANGGIDNPIDYILNPKKTLIIAGVNDDAGMAFAETAASAGVPESHIFFIPLSLKELSQTIERLLTVVEDEDDDMINDTWSGNPLVSSESRIKKIAVVGFRGGVGRSTIATSLADHYSGNGEAVAILDLGSPAATYKHFGVEEPSEARDGLVVIKSKLDIYIPECAAYNYPADMLKKVVNELKSQYRRVIVDLSAEPPDGQIEVISPDSTVVVVDYDMVLTAKPAANIEGIFVYNRAVPEVSEEIVAGVLGGIEPVVIKMDIEGCMAALVSGEPAYHTSEAVAEGIGQLAAKIG